MSEYNNQYIPNRKPFGMKWYKYLIYFGLFTSAVVNIVYSFTYMFGGIYFIESNGLISSELVYSYYGIGLKVIDIIFGLCCLFFGVLAVVLRQKLANYKSDALKWVKIYYSFYAGAPFVYAILIAGITGEVIAVDMITSMIKSLLFLFLNLKYFKKRAYLFGDSTAYNNQEVYQDYRENEIYMSTSKENNEKASEYSLSSLEEAAKSHYKYGQIRGEDLMLQDGSEAEVSLKEAKWITEGNNIEVALPEEKVTAEPTLESKINQKQISRYCSKCGHAIDSLTKKCTGCGKQYFKGISWKVVLTSLLCILLVVSVVGNVLLYISNTDLKEAKSAFQQENWSLESDIDWLEAEVDKLEKDIKDLEKENGQYYDYWVETFDKLAFFDEYVVFVADNGTGLYHKYDCGIYQDWMGKFWAFNTEYAEWTGYSPCSKCYD